MAFLSVSRFPLPCRVGDERVPFCEDDRSTPTVGLVPLFFFFFYVNFPVRSVTLVLPYLSL